MNVLLLITSVLLFVGSASLIFLLRDTIEDSIWFIPLLSGLIIGFMTFIVLLRKGAQDEQTEINVPTAKKPFTIILGGLAFFIGAFYTVSAILSTHYLYFVPTNEQWSKIHTEDQYRGKCYTRSIDRNNIECIGTGYDQLLEILIFVTRKSSRNVVN